MTFTIRPMTPHDLSTAIDWAAAEGWNPGLADAPAFLAEDPAGFLMGFVDGAPAACISVVRYGADYGFLGFYIAGPEFRGQGFGIQVWDAGMAHLAGRTVGLDGVVDQQANYAKSGFILAHRNIRYGGQPEGRADPAVIPADPARVLPYDAPFFPSDRAKFLRAWLSTPGHVARMLVENGEITGYGVLRPCREGAKIGPLFADTEAGAERLFRALVAEAPPGPVYLDPPETNAAAIALAERHGMTPSFETARMYRGPAPDLPLGRTFGITTFELG
jgi:RimJ/RimL family protein N-acetyltransferase